MVKKLHTGTLAPYDNPFHFIRLGRFTIINKTTKSLKITAYGFKITIEEAKKEITHNARDVAGPRNMSQTE